MILCAHLCHGNQCYLVARSKRPNETNTSPSASPTVSASIIVSTIVFRPFDLMGVIVSRYVDVILNMEALASVDTDLGIYTSIFVWSKN